VGSLFDVRSGERRGAAAAFLTLFGMLAAHTLLETARDALFLARLPASQLPWMYIVMAAMAVALARSPWPGTRGLGRYAVSLLLVACAAGTFLFWGAGRLSSPWALRALYVWNGLVGTLTTLQFWLVLGELYTVGQAKRLYKVVGAGSLLGAVCGAAAARWVAMNLTPAHLVPVSAFTLLATALGPALLVRRPAHGRTPADEAPVKLGEGLALLRGHAYVRGLAGLVLISTVALTLADYVFKSTVARNVPPQDLGAFLATFYMGLNVAALVVQLLAVGWVLRVLGLHRALWALPALMFLGSSGVVFGGGLLAALLLKSGDGALRHSLHRTSTELLFVPLPDRARAVAKPLIDVAGQRGGQALASVLILSQVGIGRGDTVLAIAAAVLCVAWIAWATDLKKHYLELFRAALRQGMLPRTEAMPPLDLGSLEALFAGLNSGDDSEVVAAIELLAEQGRERLIPALILYHPSRAVVLSALDQFARSRRTDFVSVADRLLQHEDAEVRAAALRARASVVPDPRALRAALEDRSPLVRAVALAGLAAQGEAAEAEEAMRAMVAEGSVETRAGLAQAMALVPDARFAGLLVELAEDPDVGVLLHVARAMAALRDPRFVPALIPMVARHEVRREARDALLAIGAPALDQLEAAMGDPDMPHELRRHLPRTISRFEAAAAVPILLRHLLAESDGMVRFKIIRGLGRLADENPEVPFDAAIVREGIARTMEAALRLLHWRSVLAEGARREPAWATRGHHLLRELVEDKEVHATERIFRLLNLLHRDEDFRSMHRGLRSALPKVRASSRELLENLLEPPLREAVLALVDEVPAALRLDRAAAFYRAAPLRYEEVLAAILDEPGETLRSVAAHHVGELRLRALRPRLEALRGEAGFFVTRVVHRALARLDEDEPLRAAAHAR
jgi:HEAT repeat protein